MPEHTVSENRGRNRFGHNSKTSMRGHVERHPRNCRSSKTPITSANKLRYREIQSSIYFRLKDKEYAYYNIYLFNKYGEI